MPRVESGLAEAGPGADGRPYPSQVRETPPAGRCRRGFSLFVRHVLDLGDASSLRAVVTGTARLGQGVRREANRKGADAKTRPRRNGLSLGDRNHAPNGSRTLRFALRKSATLRVTTVKR